MSWEQLKNDGEIYQALHRALVPHTHAELAPDTLFSDWDEILTEIDYDDDGTIREVPRSYEDKMDKMTCFTGNVPIEHHGYRGKSGINATKADYWIHFIHNYSRIPGERYYYRIPVADLKKMIRDKKYKCDTQGGNNNYVSMYIFDENTFQDYKVIYHTNDIPSELLEKIHNIKPTYSSHIESVRKLLLRTTGETHI